MKRFLLSLVLLVCIATVAKADIYTDIYNPADTLVTTSSGTWINHIMDITDNGFPHPLEYVTSATLTVWLYDDYYDPSYPTSALYEYATVIYDGTEWNLGEVGNDDYGHSITASLLSDGLLNITVKSTGGDFYFDQSKLCVNTCYSAVPVPGAFLLGMLGLGAAGIKLRKYA
jgi:hypothetical protein